MVEEGFVADEVRTEAEDVGTVMEARGYLEAAAAGVPAVVEGSTALRFFPTRPATDVRVEIAAIGGGDNDSRGFCSRGSGGINCVGGGVSEIFLSGGSSRACAGFSASKGRGWLCMVTVAPCRCE